MEPQGDQVPEVPVQEDQEHHEDHVKLVKVQGLLQSEVKGPHGLEGAGQSSTSNTARGLKML